MSKIIEYYNHFLTESTEAKELSKSFINFYLYFSKLHEKKIISDNIMYFLDAALDFSEPVFENSYQTHSYLIAKQFQIEHFLARIELEYNKIFKNLKKVFNMPSNFSSSEVCNIIEQSYIAYASIRYQHNHLNTRVFEKEFQGEKMFYNLPQVIPESNANISEFLEMMNGIKQLSVNGKTYDLFNIFNQFLHIRAIVNATTGQIVAIFVNGEEYTDVPLSFIQHLKECIKRDSNIEVLVPSLQKNKN